MRGWMLLATVAGVGGLAYYYRARWLPALQEGAESIYGSGVAAPKSGSALAKGSQGSTAGGEQRALAAKLGVRSSSPVAATNAGAATTAAALAAKAGDGPSPYSAGTPLFRPPVAPQTAALASNLTAARLWGK